MASETTLSTQQSARPSLLTEDKAAEYLGIKANTLAAWRCTKRVDGPRYVKMGGAVRYTLRDLEAFVEKNTVNP